MPVKLLMGNEAIGIGAVRAGVRFVAGYPGTPSTEVLETVAKNNPGSIHVEWSVNEKAALEAAIGASYSGQRALVTMKQVGLNVAADPLMTLSYMGVKGGLVLVVADDPGPISSQTEQDTRTFGRFSKVPVLDPDSAGEAYSMIQDAFTLSEQFSTPVIVRPTTRVCHACGTVHTHGDEPAEEHGRLHPDRANSPMGKPVDYDEDGNPMFEFEKDDARWVVFPKTSNLNHGKVERRAINMSAILTSGFHPNRIELSAMHHHQGADEFTSHYGRHYDFGIAAGGISYRYVKEALEILGLNIPVFKVGVPYPFPNKLGLQMLRSCDTVLVVEELDPVIERELYFLKGGNEQQTELHGKLDGTFPFAGEQSVEAIVEALEKLTGAEPMYRVVDRPGAPEAPARPPVLCAGCPHRASFYAVKQAMRGHKTVYTGDIGCYTLGNAQPLSMVDTCLCMGAGITMAQGMGTADPGVNAFSFIGDSTFFASGITGVVNAVYNQHDEVICILDNSTTAMTGHQPHPGTGRTMMGVDGAAMDIEAILKGIGVECVRTVDPLDHEASVETVREVARMRGVRCIIFKSPCISVAPPLHPQVRVNASACTDCRRCITQIGCPALCVGEGHVYVDTTQCYGCELCVGLCRHGAIERGE